MEEKRKGYVGAILVSPLASNWFVDSLEEACLILVKVDFAKSYWEEGKELMVHGGGNKAGGFLQVGIYVDSLRVVAKVLFVFQKAEVGMGGGRL